ncbi:MAG: HNH endonuclease [Sulfurovum sp.]|nr:HNH endonuclease [Sulfurovum sp.]
MSKRKHWSENDKIFLFNEVNGLCPLCEKSLMYTKNAKLEKNINIAHIYPHSPKPDELITLKGVEKLTDDSEHLHNVICLCPECHLKFDKPRTLEEYNNLLKIKKELLKKREIEEEFHDYKIEEDIKQVLEILSTANIDGGTTSLEYSPTTIDNKANDTLTPLTLRDIKNDVSDFFHIIKHEFQNIDAINSGKAEEIATQIKSFYLKAKSKDNNQEKIFKYLTTWLHSKTNISEKASSIVISFFIQDCEVFDVISK